MESVTLTLKSGVFFPGIQIPKREPRERTRHVRWRGRVFQLTAVRGQPIYSEVEVVDCG